MTIVKFKVDTLIEANTPIIAAHIPFFRNGVVLEEGFWDPISILEPF